MNVVPGEFSPTWGVLHGGLGWDSTFGITCEHCFEEMGESAFISTPVGTGPYVARKWTGNDEIRVRWPSGRTQVVEDVPANQVVQITEPES